MSPGRRRARWDHPRSRGVYTRSSVRRIRRRGSSPLARGLRGENQGNINCRGIIPARAGFTRCSISIVSLSWDHPRSRGVYSPKESPMYTYTGSSPLARGLRSVTSEDCCARRIIPARAGFTRRRSPVLTGCWDHPRSRGVYLVGGLPCPPDDGSSPLARGLPGDWSTGDGDAGIIPARAGFTSLYISGLVVYTDHPRSRGVYTCARPAASTTRGSSPLARGLHERTRSAVAMMGIIPARAGFTLLPGSGGSG